MNLNAFKYLMVLPFILEAYCEDSYIQINFRKPINIIDDKFISFSIDSKYLFSGYYTQWLNGTTQNVIEKMGPAFIKLNVNPHLKLHEGNTLEQMEESNKAKQFEFGVQEWRNLHKWANKHRFTPVVQLEYDAASWKARDTLSVLGVANDIGIKNCVWQFGSELNSTSLNKYAEDLNAFNALVKVFPKEKTQWKVLSASFKQSIDVADTDHVYDSIKNIVDVVSWQPHLSYVTARYNDIFLNKDASMRYLLRSEKPVWMMLRTFLNNWSSPHDCGSTCKQETLYWAQLLGDSAKSGFEVIFKPLGKRDLVKPNFKYYITRLFKHLIGNKVFAVTGLKGDRFLAHHYAFCSKNQTGGFVLMVINSDENKLKTDFKLTLHQKKCTIHQYSLTVCDESFCLNDQRLTLESELNPIVKKKNIKRTISLTTAPYSVTFFVFPNTDIEQCKEGAESVEFNSIEESAPKMKRSSVDKLIEELALENLNLAKRNFEPTIRVKRQLSSKLKEFNLFKHLTPQARSIPNSNLNNGKILLVNKPQKANIPGIDDENSSIEEKIFKSSENNNLPKGEMHLFVGPESRDNPEADYDYVEFDDKRSKSKKKNNSLKMAKLEKEDDYVESGIREQSVEVEAVDNFFDNFGGEFVRPASVHRNDKQSDNREIGEVTASKIKVGFNRKQDISKNGKEENLQYAVLIKELQPTVRQNQLNRKKAEKKLKQMHMGEDDLVNDELEDAQSIEDYADYYSEDDERFFNSDEEVEKTKRNSPNRIDATDAFQSDRLINVVGKLLKKIERRVADENVKRKGNSIVRTRRTVDSVLVPKRKTKKFTRAISKTKQVSKAKPIDIKDIVSRGLNQLRKKRHVLWDDNEDWNTNRVDKEFYLLTNDIESINEKKEAPSFDSKNFQVVPNRKDFDISAEFIMQPKNSNVEKKEIHWPNYNSEGSHSQETSESMLDDIDFPTEIVTVKAQTYKPTILKPKPMLRTVEGKYLKGVLEPFIKFYEGIVKTSFGIWSSLFQNEHSK